jgi:hypothetical protein
MRGFRPRRVGKGLYGARSPFGWSRARFCHTAHITEDIEMAARTFAFRLPLPGLPRATFVTDYRFSRGQLLIDGVVLLDATSRDALTLGMSVTLPGTHQQITLRADDDDLVLLLDGVAARREDQLVAPTSRSAWMHGWIALAGSVFGFVASYMYLQRAKTLDDAWSLRMALHMAAWHFLLTLTLFPASVWGQRLGIRAVQAMSLLFFAIHVCIAISNAGSAGAAPDQGWIAFLNAASGFAFLGAVLYGQRAHHDMDPTPTSVIRAT